MPQADSFADTFAELRTMLQRFTDTLVVSVDKPGDYQLCSRSMKDRKGNPLFVAAVQTKKNYVSYHLMPIYARPDLLNDVSPALRKRMQGKSCFNFTRIEPAQVEELGALTKRGLEAFKKVVLPW